MSESPLLGPKLTPPHGGLLRLQQAVQQREQRHFRTRVWVAAGVTASLIALSLLLVVPGALRQHRMNLSVRQALTATPQTHFENGAYVMLPTRNPNVQILLVRALPSRQSTANQALVD
ncbi:MAG TPA: hypothetical protein VFL15_06105 [Gammaproteobacteria bacterium]|nr:hypothetical protein [Gammaproteobacteria bacterium]